MLCSVCICHSIHTRYCLCWRTICWRVLVYLWLADKNQFNSLIFLFTIALLLGVWSVSLYFFIGRRLKKKGFGEKWKALESQWESGAMGNELPICCISSLADTEGSKGISCNAPGGKHSVWIFLFLETVIIGFLHSWRGSTWDRCAFRNFWGRVTAVVDV